MVPIVCDSLRPGCTLRPLEAARASWTTQQRSPLEVDLLQRAVDDLFRADVIGRQSCDCLGRPAERHTER